ncbi:DUF945 family protein [Marinobacter sp. M1N3S26]|uniref:DUF945 family protein n=1 Tax=unclassified Marinobacter TaxID=83889 RepID=UPI00387A97E3
MSDAVTTPSGSNKGKIAIAIIVILAALYFAASWFINSQAEAKVVEAIETIEEESDGDAVITYDSVDSSLFSSSATLNGVLISSKSEGDLFKADNITVVMEGYTENERLPDNFSLSVKNLLIVNEKLLTEMSSFAEVDYREHPMDFHFGYDVNNGKDELASNLTWSTEGLSSLNHEMTLSDVSGGWEALQAAYKQNSGSTDFTPAQQQAIQAELQSVRFNRTQLRYENDGEVELMMEAVARENGVTADQFKAQILAGMEQQLGDSEVVGEIRAFIEDPKQLSITIEPEEPLSMEELTQISMMLMMGATADATKMLGLTVDAN